MCGSFELRIATSAAPAPCDHNAVVAIREVVHLLTRLGVVNDGSDRNFQQDVFPFTSSFVRTFAMTAALRFVFGVEAKMDQRVVPLAGFHDDVAALAAITAGGPSTRNKLLPPKSKTAVAAVAGLYANCGFINEHESSRWSSASDRRPNPAPENVGQPPSRLFSSISGRIGLKQRQQKSVRFVKLTLRPEARPSRICPSSRDL